MVNIFGRFDGLLKSSSSGSNKQEVRGKELLELPAPEDEDISDPWTHQYLFTHKKFVIFWKIWIFI